MGYVNFDKYPNEFALHKKYAQSPLILDLVWTHCNIIADVALGLLKNGKFDTSFMDDFKLEEQKQTD